MWMNNLNRHYKNAASWHLHIHDYHNPVLYELIKLCRHLYEFSQAEDRSDLYLEFNHEIRSLVNRFISLPLPYDELISQYTDTIEIQRKASRLSRFYPPASDTFRAVPDILKQLESEPQPVAVLLKELSESKKSNEYIFRLEVAGIKTAVEEFFAHQQIPFRVMTKSEIKQSTPPLRIIAVGPVHWYAGSTLLPETKNLHIIKPSWLSSKARFSSPFSDGESYIDFALENEQP